MDTEFHDAKLTDSAGTRLGWRAGYLLAAFGVYMVDQMSKAWAVRNLRFQGDRTVIQGFFDLIYNENPGIAFGQLQQGGSIGRWFFVGLAIVAAAAVLYYFLRTPRNDDRVLGACALLLAGIAGNLTDRLRLGYVIDFIALHAHSYHWPTFNVADASITMGALLLAYDLLFERKKTEARDQRSEVKGQKSEVSGQKTEVRGQKSEVSGQKTEVRGQKSEVRDQEPAVGGQKSEVKGQKSEVRVQ
jgi:signal peptidase II